MPYALCADIHAHSWSQFSRVNPDGVNSRLQDILDEMFRLAEAAQKAGCTRILVDGDVFHVRGSVKPSVLNPVVATMLALAGRFQVEWVVMAGNHDLEGSESTWLGAAIVALGEEDMITTIVGPTLLSEERCALVPWHNTRDGLIAAIERLKDEISGNGEMVEDYDLHLHTGINGVIFGMPDHGWSPAELAQFGFKRVFSGHYHNHKVFDMPRFGGGDTQVVSIGALTHQTWSDVDTKAGWLIVDENDFAFTESSAPKFMDFDPDAALDVYDGQYVRVKGIELEEEEIRQLRDELERLGAAGISIHAVPKSRIVTRNGAAASSVATLEGSISDWIKQAAIDHEREVEKEAMSVLAEARGA